jgi:hypothetical protein
MSERWRDVMNGTTTVYTYPGVFDNRLARAVWRFLFCRRGWHLWDEVLSGVEERHYLTCDACTVRFIGHDWCDDEG